MVTPITCATDDLYKQGASSGKIGKQLGCDDHTVLRSLRSAGIQIRPQLRAR